MMCNTSENCWYVYENKVIVTIIMFKIPFLKFQTEIDENLLSPEEAKERKIMKLLLKIKNGTPPMRKVSVYEYVITVILIS